MSETRSFTQSVRVRDCMHHGVFTCAGDDPLREVAGIMVKNRVHSVVITGNGGRPIGVVSDLDLLAAVAGRAECTAGEAAATEPLTVVADEAFETAARLMNEHGVSHLVVVDADEGFPLGVLSSLDVAAVYAES